MHARWNTEQNTKQNQNQDRSTDYLFSSEEMGQRHNRKRIRHRPMSRSYRSITSLMPATEATATSSWALQHFSLPQATMRINVASLAFRETACTLPKLLQQESANSRDRRIFGGVDEDTESAKNLCGPMLDVVLGLFNGIDYDDAALS